jgi:flagellar FliL protein
MTAKKLIIGVVAVLLIAGYAAKTILLAPPPAHMKVNGTIYVLPKEFTLNLSDGHYATLTVGLLLAPGQSTGTSDPNNPPPTGFGTLPEEPLVRDIITNLVTDSTEASLLNASGRARLEHHILVAIRGGTDVKVDRILFTDVAVQ